MITQTLAILLDAYRELHAKKMFWIVMILTIGVMGLFSLLGVNDHTLTILWFEPMGDMTANGNSPSPMSLYKWVYSNFVVGFWLTWLATLLALISTAGIFPDFLSSGSIDLFLAKLIGRLRLFFTKYLAGLLFVTLQVTVFTVMSFLALGLRAHLWEPGLFFAIPLVVLFFSYLFAICVFFGVLTRSTIAALLLALLCWLGIFLVDYVDKYVERIPQTVAMQKDFAQNQIDSVDAQIEQLKKADPAPPAERLTELESRRAQLVSQRDSEDVPPALVTTQRVLFALKSFVPKTRETINLLDRVLFRDKDLQEQSKHEQETAAPAPVSRRAGARVRFSDSITSQIELDRKRPVWWIIGTSLLLEAGFLALAAWLFCRRDF